MPVAVFVNPYILRGLIDEGGGAHWVVVIVGFDEEEGLVYYNDPASTIEYPHEFYGVDDWKYVPVYISDFKRAVNGCSYSKGQFCTFQKVGEPVEVEERLRRGREMELLRIRGDPTLYPYANWTVGINGSIGIDGLHAFKEGIDDVWENWEEWNETERTIMMRYASRQLNFFQERAHINGKYAEYLKSAGAEEAEIYAQFGTGCGHIAEKLWRICNILGDSLRKGKLSDRQIDQVNSDLEYIEEETDNLIVLWEELSATLGKSLEIQ